MPTREEQKEARRNEILMTALDIFIKKGYAGTRITDIAEAVNMSTGLLFHYFESKEKLYETLVEFGVSGPVGVMAMDNTDPITFFRIAAETILSNTKDNPFVAKIFVLMAQAWNQGPNTEKMQQLLPQITAIEDSVKIIEKGQKMGQIKAGDPMALSVLFWCAIQGVAQASAMNPEYPLPEVQWLVDILKK